MMIKLFGVIVVFWAIAIGFFYQNNPLLFGKRTKNKTTKNNFTIYNHYPQLDDELFPLTASVGKDFTAYRNHCLRVLTFTKYFLDKEYSHVTKSIPNAMELVAVALAYHDAGLWTDKALNYLEPSKELMDKTVGSSGGGDGGEKDSKIHYTAKELKIMDEIILQHHKIMDFNGFDGQAENDLVNAVRKADWADATMGVIRFGLPTELLEEAYDKIPETGFHDILLGLLTKLTNGHFFKGVLEISKIFRW